MGERLSASALFIRILAALALMLALVLAGGTVYALFFSGVPPGSPSLGASSSTTASPAASSPAAGSPARPPALPSLPAASREPEADRVFAGIGRIRTVTAPPEATVVLSVAFPYASADRAFSEELAARVGDLRNAAAGYFAALSPAELQEKGEEAVKAELLDRYNRMLRLGRIETLYFNDYMIIE
jgi:flagellar basal body-associated protein FliL